MEKELKEIIKEDKAYYYSSGLKRVYRFFTHNPVYQRGRYVVLCRKAGHYAINQSHLMNKLLFLYYARKKHLLGEKLNIEFGPAKFGRRLKIYHGNIVVNGLAIIGDDCELYGSNCIGNKGTSIEDAAPVQCNKVSVGVGSKIIGNVHVANGVRISSVSLVNKNLTEEHSLYGGVPAVFIKNL